MSGADIEHIKKIANSLAISLSSFKEVKMQRVLLAERLGKLSADTVADTLYYFVSESEKGNQKFKSLMNCLLDIPFLVSALGNEKMGEIYNILGDKGHNNVRELMVSYPSKTKVAEDELISFPDVDGLPLGVKKTLAKSNKKHLLDKLIYEENPTVIRGLLANPKITEKDALKIASRRPIKREIIIEIINSKRWIDRHIIKKAIIRNPYSPTEIALNLIHFMLLQDLQDIILDKGLHPSIQDAARKLIEKKRHEK